MPTENMQQLMIQDDDDGGTMDAGIDHSNKIRFKSPTNILLLAVLIISIGSLVMSLRILSHKNHQSKQTSNRAGFCVICSELHPRGYFDTRAEKFVASLDQFVDDGVQMCCARNSSDRNEILKLQLKRKDSLMKPQILNGRPIDTNDLNFGGISAHKTFTWPKDGNRKFGDRLYTLELNTSMDPRYEHVQGLKVTPRGLKVKVAGLYFVYKSIFFVPNSGSPCRKFKSQTFSSMLVRNSTRSVSRTDMLLRSEHTCCPDCIQNRETSFTGGIFYLAENDLIQVQISAYGLVYFKKDASYMGLIIVGGPVPKI